MKRIELTQEECFCGLTKFYENVASKGFINVPSTAEFDCRKINVSKKVQDEIFKFCQEESGYTKYEMSTAWLICGPKASLENDGYVAEVEDGFVEV